MLTTPGTGAPQPAGPHRLGPTDWAPPAGLHRLGSTGWAPPAGLHRLGSTALHPAIGVELPWISVGFSRAQLEALRGATLPDLLGPDVRLLFVGINPGLMTVATQSHFGRRGNRFYPALYRAGITDRRIDAAAGFDPADVAHLHERGIGITNLVAQATARADELGPEELLAGATRLRRTVSRVRPAVVAILGISAYRVAFADRRATVGRQPQDMGPAQLWVVPNPSGLNAHASLVALADSYREVARAAGIVLYPAPA